MTLVGGFSQQTVNLERKSGTNAYGETTYSAPVRIKARYEPSSGMRRSAMGVDIEVESYILTETEIRLGDLIEGSEVRRVEPIIAKNGKTLGYEAYL